MVEHVAARTTAEQRRVLDYWTPRRMAEALPISLLDIVIGEKGLLSELTGRVGLRTVLDPAGVRTALPLAASKLPVPRHHAASAPKTSTIGSRWATGGAVARTTGRVFMTVGGVDFVCSASTVKSANRDVVVTAGHCVKDGAGEWAANWTFVPGYGTRGEQPHGRYAARRMFVAGPWSRDANDDYDVGMVALATSGGKHVADVVGTQEIAFNAPRGGQAFGFGYPADPPYNGDHLVYCRGRLTDDPHGETRDQGLGCDMTAGSSGGPWMTTFDATTGKGTITSLSSFKYSDDPRTMYGPYLGDAAKTLFSTAERA
ncbi:trypsin-like serine protease [Nonomuraea basaltis]|nr:trypsin-like serine protease [Nonomuraea basaltis]